MGLVRSSALIDGEVLVGESRNHNKVIARFKLTKIPGGPVTSADWDTGTRLQEVYAKAGKELQRLVKSKAR